MQTIRRGHTQNVLICQDKNQSKKVVTAYFPAVAGLTMPHAAPVISGKTPFHHPMPGNINKKGTDPRRISPFLYAWCRRSELNRHGRKARRILSPLRLPVSPLRQATKSLRDSVILSIKARRFIVNRIIALSMNGCCPNPFSLGIFCLATAYSDLA